MKLARFDLGAHLDGLAELGPAVQRRVARAARTAFAEQSAACQSRHTALTDQGVRFHALSADRRPSRPTSVLALPASLQPGNGIYRG